MDYGRILRRALHITWRYRALWAFGILFALFSGGGGGGGQNQLAQYSLSRGEIRPGMIAGIILIALVVLFVLVPLSFAVRYISRGALISMVQDVETRQSTRFGDGLRAGASRALPLLGITVVFFVPTFIMSAILVGIGLSPLLLLIVQTEGARIIAIVATVGLMLLMVGLLIVLHVSLSVIREFVDRQCVLRGMGVMESIQSGWRIVRANVGRIALLWLTLLGVGLVWGILMLPIILVLGAIVVLPVMGINAATQAPIPTIATAIVLGIPALAVLVFLAGLYEVFRSTVWTLAYLELAPELGETT